MTCDRRVAFPSTCGRHARYAGEGCARARGVWAGGEARGGCVMGVVGRWVGGDGYIHVV